MGLFTKKKESIQSRTDLINYLLKYNNYQRYLEIGVRSPRDNFEKIQATFKDGVDPAGRCSHRMTSDRFFSEIAPNKEKYDLIFIDGLHLAEQAEKDLNNSITCLSKRGIIIVHDCNPPSEDCQVEEYVNGEPWNGTTWKAFAAFRVTRCDLYMCTVDIDQGCGIVAHGQQKCFELPEAFFMPTDASGSQHSRVDYKKMNFSFLAEHRQKLLNLLSVSDFIEQVKTLHL